MRRTLLFLALLPLVVHAQYSGGIGRGDVANASACPTATISYASAAYCVSSGPATPTLTGNTGGTFSSSAGLTINATTGEITPTTSTPGSYVATYRIPASASCAVLNATFNLSITPLPTAICGGPYFTFGATPVAVAVTSSASGSWSGLGTFANASDQNTTYTPAPAEVGTDITITWTIPAQGGVGGCVAVSSSATITSTNPISGSLFAGGNGRGDVAVLITPTLIASSIFSGGDGRGNIAAVFSPTPISSSIFSGGDGRGDIAAVFAATPIASSIFSGGNGRGDIAAVCAPTPIASSIFSGGNGRGDIAALFSPPLIASNIFSGGDGRGDVAALFLPTTTPSNIYSGGNGRGDIAHVFAPSRLENAVAGTVFCANGGSAVVTYTTLATYAGGNVFTAELSDATGSFANPIGIGSVASQSSGVINGIIPVVPAGSAYRIRVVSSLTVIIGTDNGVDLTLIGPANAGPDQAVCGTAATLAANAATVGTGAWSIISGAGGSVTMPSSPTSAFTGVGDTAYTLRWSMSNAACGSSTDDVVMTLTAPPTIANAGPDQSVCASSVTLAANTPSTGTGTWSVVSGGPGVFSDPSSPSSGFTGTINFNYTLRWTISNGGSCPASFDDVEIRPRGNPTPANAGSDQTLCGTSVGLSGSSAFPFVPTWSIVSGFSGGSISTSGGGEFATLTTTNSGQESTYTVRYTISNAPCPASTDDAVITFRYPPPSGKRR